MDTGKPADLSDLLNLLRVQRHDFLNHLQVISGFLQLGKADRAIDYIRQISGDIQEAGKLMQLGMPNLVATILLCHREAEQEQVILITRVQSAEAFLPSNDYELAQLVRKATAFALQNLRKLPPGPKSLELTIVGAREKACVRLALDNAAEMATRLDWEAFCAACRPLLESCGASLTQNEKGGRVEIELSLVGPGQSSRGSRAVE